MLDNILVPIYPSFLGFLAYGQKLIDALADLYQYIFVMTASDAIMHVLDTFLFSVLEYIPFFTVPNWFLNGLANLFTLIFMGQPLYIVLCSALITVALMTGIVKLVFGLAKVFVDLFV